MQIKKALAKELSSQQRLSKNITGNLSMPNGMLRGWH